MSNQDLEDLAQQSNKGKLADDNLLDKSGSVKQLLRDQSSEHDLSKLDGDQPQFQYPDDEEDNQSQGRSQVGSRGRVIRIPGQSH